MNSREIWMTVHLRCRDIFGSRGEDLEQHIRALRRYARALVGDSADADDLVQETLKRALIYIGRGQEIRHVRAYLLTMLHNVRVDMVKSQIRAAEVLTSNDDLPLATMPPQNDQVTLKQVSEAVERLPEGQREVILLIGLEGMGYKETAEILGLPIGTVMSRLSRARRALKDDLQVETVEIEAQVLRTEPGQVGRNSRLTANGYGRAA